VPELHLACIHCREPLSRSTEVLSCSKCNARYPIVDGVARLLPASPTLQQRDQTAYFDAEFADYSHYRPENWRLSFVSRIFRALEVDQGRGPYLDVGVGGSGATVIEAARRGVEAFGCDLSIRGVTQAHRFAELEGVADRARFAACAAESLPFPDASFGCASSVAVLEHLDEDHRAAEELGRILQAGGLVWITVPNAYRHMPEPLRPIYRRHDRRLGHKRHYGEEELVALMERAGLHHIETSYSGHPVKVAQLVLDRVVPNVRCWRSRVWWKLEEIDLRADSRASGALQLSALFRAG
jgi:SAM-dependent methyltransferase